MTSVTEDNLNSEIIDGKPLETLTITSIGTKLARIFTTKHSII